jgi:hypothetical protein
MHMNACGARSSARLGEVRRLPTTEAVCQRNGGPGTEPTAVIKRRVTFQAATGSDIGTRMCCISRLIGVAYWNPLTREMPCYEGEL